VKGVDFIRGETAMEDRRSVKAKAKGRGKIAWPLDYGGAEHFIARMGYKFGPTFQSIIVFTSNLFSQLGVPNALRRSFAI
jgi:hypothetical protein